MVIPVFQYTYLYFMDIQGGNKISDPSSPKDCYNPGTTQLGDYQSSRIVATGCDSSQRLYNGTCYSNSPSIPSCFIQDGAFCIKCEPQYAVDSNDKCSSCPALCETCSYNTTSNTIQCDSCDPHSQLNQIDKVTCTPCDASTEIWDPQTAFCTQSTPLTKTTDPDLTFAGLSPLKANLSHIVVSISLKINGPPGNDIIYIKFNDEIKSVSYRDNYYESDPQKNSLIKINFYVSNPPTFDTIKLVTVFDPDDGSKSIDNVEVKAAQQVFDYSKDCLKPMPSGRCMLCNIYKYKVKQKYRCVDVPEGKYPVSKPENQDDEIRDGMTGAKKMWGLAPEDIQECYDGYTLVDLVGCVACSSPCLTCSGSEASSPSNCTGCPVDQGLQSLGTSTPSSTCTTCSGGCQKCSLNYSICEECLPGSVRKVISQTQTECVNSCEDPNCQDCGSTSGLGFWNQCASCLSPYVVNITLKNCWRDCSNHLYHQNRDTCSDQCHPRCLSCTGPGAGECLGCSTGHLDVSGEYSPSNCVECPSTCTACSSDNQCSSCGPGRLLNSLDTMCYLCPEGCGSCSSDNLCSLCGDQWYYDIPSKSCLPLTNDLEVVEVDYIYFNEYRSRINLRFKNSLLLEIVPCHLYSLTSSDSRLLKIDKPCIWNSQLEISTTTNNTSSSSNSSTEKNNFKNIEYTFPTQILKQSWNSLSIQFKTDQNLKITQNQVLKKSLVMVENISYYNDEQQTQMTETAALVSARLFLVAMFLMMITKATSFLQLVKLTQYIEFMLYFDIPYPVNLKIFLRRFSRGVLELLPNVLAQRWPENVCALPLNFKENDATCYYLENLGNLFVGLVALSLFKVFVFLISQAASLTRIKRVESTFRTINRLISPGLFILYLDAIFFEVVLFSNLQIRTTDYTFQSISSRMGSVGLNYMMACSSLLYSLLLMFFLVVVSRVLNPGSKNGGVILLDSKSKRILYNLEVSFLYKDFKKDNVIGQFYFVVQQAKNILNGVPVVLLSQYPPLLIASQILINIIYFGILVAYQPFLKNRDNIKECFSQFFICLALIGFVFILREVDLSDKFRYQVIGQSLIVIFIIIFGINLIFSGIDFFEYMYNLVKNSWFKGGDSEADKSTNTSSRNSGRVRQQRRANKVLNIGRTAQSIKGEEEVME